MEDRHDKCVICGKDVIKTRHNQVTCLMPECRKTRYRDKRKEYNKNHPPRTREYYIKKRVINFAICSCGEAFHLPGNYTDLCPKCRVKRKIKQERIGNAKWQKGVGKESHNRYSREYARRKAGIPEYLWPHLDKLLEEHKNNSGGQNVRKVQVNANNGGL